MIEILCSQLPTTFCEIDQLAAILLRFCREHAEGLRRAYDDARLCSILAEESDNMERWLVKNLEEDWLDEDELSWIFGFLRRAARNAHRVGTSEQAAVTAARALAGALDRSHGRRFASVFRGRGATRIHAGDPIPIPHPPLKDLFAGNLGTNPHRLGPLLDELHWLRLMPDVARGHRVILDFQHDDVLANLSPDTSVAVLLPCDLEDMHSDRSLEPSPRFFRVRPRDAAHQQEAVLGMLDQVAKAGVRIALLPELCLDEDGLAAVAEWHARASHDLSILVCGSVHCLRDGEQRNVATLILRDGSRVEHFKFNPFYLDLPSVETGKPTSYREDIVTTPSVITIHMCADWSFSTLICKDFLEPGVGRILEDARVRLVLVPACSPKTTVFAQTAGMLAARAQSVVVIANMADPSEHDPACAIIARPTKRETIEQVWRSDVDALPRLLVFELVGKNARQ